MDTPVSKKQRKKHRRQSAPSIVNLTSKVQQTSATTKPNQIPTISSNLNTPPDQRLRDSVATMSSPVNTPENPIKRAEFMPQTPVVPKNQLYRNRGRSFEQSPVYVGAQLNQSQFIYGQADGITAQTQMVYSAYYASQQAKTVYASSPPDGPSTMSQFASNSVTNVSSQALFSTAMPLNPYYGCNCISCMWYVSMSNYYNSMFYLATVPSFSPGPEALPTLITSALCVQPPADNELPVCPANSPSSNQEDERIDPCN